MISVAGNNARACMLQVPEFGVWIADVDFDSVVALSGRVTLVIGKAALSGTIDPAFSGTFGEATHVRIVAGAGGWSKLLPPKPYVNDAGVKLSNVLQDAASAVGETLILETDRRMNAHYVRTTGPASRVLNLLAPSWWVDYAGTTRVATRTTSEASGYDLLQFDARHKVAELGVDDPAQVGVGSILRGRLDVPLRVRAVLFKIDMLTCRASAWGDLVT